MLARRAALLALAILIIPIAAAHAQPYHLRYDSRSGQYPDTSCPFWTLIDNSSAFPYLGNLLTLATSSSGANNLGYSDMAPDIVVPNPWIIEWRVRYATGTSSSPAASAVMVTPFIGGNFGIALGIALDRVFITSADLTVGSQVNVDTDGTFHTYRLVITGTAVQVLYDGSPILSGTMYTIPGTPSAKLEWGELSSLAFGGSEWIYFEHNGNNAPCVTLARESSWGHLKTLYR